MGNTNISQHVASISPTGCSQDVVEIEQPAMDVLYYTSECCDRNSLSLSHFSKRKEERQNTLSQRRVQRKTLHFTSPNSLQISSLFFAPRFCAPHFCNTSLLRIAQKGDLRICSLCMLCQQQGGVAITLAGPHNNPNLHREYQCHVRQRTLGSLQGTPHPRDLKVEWKVKIPNLDLDG